jgi:hypothetical protein
MSKHKSKKWSVGFIDLCRIDDRGDVHCNDSPAVKKKFGVDRYLPIDKDAQKCADWDPSVPHFTKTGNVNKKACRRWEKTNLSQDVKGKPGPRSRKIGGGVGRETGRAVLLEHEQGARADVRHLARGVVSGHPEPGPELAQGRRQGSEAAEA